MELTLKGLAIFLLIGQAYCACQSSISSCESKMLGNPGKLFGSSQIIN
jgi:hypothetical protein